MNIRIGNGYDVHHFAVAPGRRLMLGGVEIPHEQGLEGVSDADVTIHAIMDALLGAAALGDIGQHFPPDDPANRGIDSRLLLERVAALLKTHGYAVVNIDCVIVAEKPKLAAYIPQMREKIAGICKIDVGQVSVKATTEEGLGLAGRGIATHCVCLIERL